MKQSKPYWFPRKRFGWGWGLPLTWQGWMVLVVFTALLIAAAFIFPPKQYMVSYLGLTGLLCLLLLAICYAKGEPPR